MRLKEILKRGTFVSKKIEICGFEVNEDAEHNVSIEHYDIEFDPTNLTKDQMIELKKYRNHYINRLIVHPNGKVILCISNHHVPLSMMYPNENEVI